MPTPPSSAKPPAEAAPPAAPLPPLRLSADPRLPAYGDERGGGRAAAIAVAALLVLAAAGGAGWYWWRQQPPTAAAVAPPPPVATAPAPGVAEPAVRHPIEAPLAPVAEQPAAPEQADAALRRALVALLGENAVLTLLQTDGFVHRVVATVDNLGRSHAAPRLWPVVPSSGRFTVQRAGDVQTAAPANAARYGAFVDFAESIDVARAATLYKSHYPLFQSAYRELGYPSGYFNDRLVDVIDLLLATPELSAPPALRLTQVQGPIADERPWLRYEFADPALEALPAGSKILLRMSPDQARRLKAQLRKFRQAIASAPARN